MLSDAVPLSPLISPIPSITCFWGLRKVGHNPTEMYARRINMLRNPLFRSFSMYSRSRWTQTFLSRGAR
jgi:hypothetical protein